MFPSLRKSGNRRRGFLNFRLKNAVLTQTLQSAASGEHLFFGQNRRAENRRH